MINRVLRISTFFHPSTVFRTVPLVVVPSGWLKAALLHVLNQLTGHFPLVSPAAGTEGLVAAVASLDESMELLSYAATGEKWGKVELRH